MARKETLPLGSTPVVRLNAHHVSSPEQSRKAWDTVIKQYAAVRQGASIEWRPRWDAAIRWLSRLFVPAPAALYAEDNDLAHRILIH